MSHPEKANPETGDSSEVARGLEGGGWGVTANECGVSFAGT